MLDKPCYGLYRVREVERIQLPVKEENDEKIIGKEKITRRDFFKITKQELERHGMKMDLCRDLQTRQGV